jgi:hypothetical protein
MTCACPIYSHGLYVRRAVREVLTSGQTSRRQGWAVRATRRLDQLRQAQKHTVGLDKGGHAGLYKNPAEPRHTLASQGIDKNLAHQARTLGALSEDPLTPGADCSNAGLRKLRAVRAHTGPPLFQVIDHS